MNLSFLLLSHELVKFENILLSKFYNPSTYIHCELSQSKTDNLCLDISGFVVVLNFGDSEGVDLVLNTPSQFEYARNFWMNKEQSYKIPFLGHNCLQLHIEIMS